MIFVLPPKYTFLEVFWLNLANAILLLRPISYSSFYTDFLTVPLCVLAQMWKSFFMARSICSTGHVKTSTLGLFTKSIDYFLFWTTSTICRTFQQKRLEIDYFSFHRVMLSTYFVENSQSSLRCIFSPS